MRSLLALIALLGFSWLAIAQDKSSSPPKGTPAASQAKKKANEKKAPEPRAPLPEGLVLEAPVDPGKDKIVFIAGGNFYKKGEHEYLKGCQVLMDLVAQNPGVGATLARDWPEKESTWANAKTVVFFFDGAEKHQAIRDKRWWIIESLAARGVGLVHLHQTADYPLSHSSKALEVAGGVWEKGRGKRAHWVETFSRFPDHPVFRGVTPFTIDDGWLWNHRFVAEKKGLTPLLRTVSPQSKDDIAADGAIIAWAYERPGQGRSLTFTGAHLHKSLEQEGYRRFLVNSILWSAGKEIPPTGARVDLKTPLP